MLGGVWDRPIDGYPTLQGLPKYKYRDDEVIAQIEARLKMNDDMDITIDDIFMLVDSCAIYPPEACDKKAMEQLRSLEKEEKINKLEITQGTEEEMKKVPLLLKDWVKDRIVSDDAVSTINEILKIKEIKNVLFPQKMQLTRGDKIDVRNIFNAQKNREYSFFVTCDKKHILSKADTIWNMYHVKAVSPSDCLREIMSLLQ
ncbi:MAG: hypothetical protein JW919_02245 [Candidatus Omnitrophica bacterium]|nr:hypothetical protein [Candidatus Omnitrophota bacterium]